MIMIFNAVSNFALSRLSNCKYNDIHRYTTRSSYRIWGTIFIWIFFPFNCLLTRIQKGPLILMQLFPNKNLKKMVRQFISNQRPQDPNFCLLHFQMTNSSPSIGPSKCKAWSMDTDKDRGRRLKRKELTKKIKQGYNILKKFVFT